MKKQTTRRLFIAAVVVSWVTLGSRDVEATQPNCAQQDPSQPYRAVILGLDVSTSLDPVQFERSKSILKDVVINRVEPNDKVWVLDVAASTPSLKPFPMPATTTRSRNRECPSALEEVKKTAVAEIVSMKQSRKTTNLEAPISHALNILAAQPGATDRSLIIVSDFVRDLDGYSPSTNAPDPAKGVSATKTNIVLVVAQPTEQYLHFLRMSGPDVYRAVKTNWSQYFVGLKASSVSVGPVDALGKS